MIGKTIGVFGGARLAVRLRLGELPANVAWHDLLPVAVLSGDRLHRQPAHRPPRADDGRAQERATAAVLAAAVVASLVAVVLLRRRSRPG